MSDKRYAVIRMDTLLFTLGGFAEPPTHKRDLWLAKLKRMWAAGAKSSEIAEALGTTRGNILAHIHKYGWARNKRLVFTSPEREAQNAIIADLWMAGNSMNAIGSKLGIKPFTVWKRIRGMGLPSHGWRSNSWIRRRVA